MADRAPKTPARLASLLLLPLALLACDGPTRSETLTFEEPIAAISVETGAGDIEVRTAQTDVIRVDALIHGSATQVQAEVSDGVLQLSHDCPVQRGGCAVDWVLLIPADGPEGLGIDLDLDSGSGDIEAWALRGDLLAHTGSGDIDLQGLDGDEVVLETGSGDIDLRDVHAYRIDLETGSGDLGLQGCEADQLEGDSGSGNLSAALTTTPRLVTLATGSGDVDLQVPSGPYALDLDTGSGDVRVDGIEANADADSLIEVSTSSGNITIQGRSA